MAFEQNHICIVLTVTLQTIA